MVGDAGRMRVVVLGLVAVLGVSGSTSADVTTFFGEDLNPTGSGPILVAGSNSEAAQNSFLAQLVGVGTEDFESFSDGTPAPLALTFPGASGSITATLLGDGNIDVVPAGQTSGAGRFPTSGTRYWTTNSTLGDFDITFSESISAFGFFATDIGDFSGQITLQLINGTTQDLIVPGTINAPNASMLYLGLISDMPFTMVRFGNTSSVDRFGFDDMTIADEAQVIPAPAAAMLPMVGLPMIGWVKRRLV